MSDPDRSPRRTHWIVKVALVLVILTTALTTLVVGWYWKHRQSEHGHTLTPSVSNAANLVPDKPRNTPIEERYPIPVDLSHHYNAALTNAWHFRSGRGSATLRALPQGLQEFGGVPFDVRGIVQLASVRTTNLPQYPERSTDIPVGGLCRALHFLQATGWMAHEGTTIASYWIRYADGTATEFPIVYGEHVREWHGRSDRSMEVASGQLAWQDDNPRTRHRLFQCRWENPKPNVDVLTIDFVSAMTDCFPFLIAITAE